MTPPFDRWHAASDWTHAHLQQTLNEAPQLILTFYRYGILLRQPTPDGGHTEYPVDPSQVATALSTHLRFETGLLDGNILSMQQMGHQHTVVIFRPAQLTGVWIEGSDAPVRLPLPPLVLMRQIGGASARYAVFAVKRRPTTWETPLFHAPLPNVYPSGSVCWGTVPVPLTLAPTQLWEPLLGSAFGNHAVSGKSRQFPSDIRQHWLHLAQSARRVYPLRDLMPTPFTLHHLITGDC